MAATGNVISAFTDEEVERLTGLTKRQLGYWDRTGFFKPEFAAENRRVALSRIYSFRDVVSLRVLSVLRNDMGVSLPHLRQVSEKLSHLDNDRWTQTTLYVLNKKVVFSDPDTGEPREVVSGQYVLGIPMAAVISKTRDDVEQMHRRADDKIGRITRQRRVAHNAPVVAGTRIPISAIKRFRDAGYSPAQIIDEYPDLTEEDIEAALSYRETRAVA